MEINFKDIITPKGKIIISGPLLVNEDLSFKDLNTEFLHFSEQGYPLISYSKPLFSIITEQFNFLFNQFEKEKYIKMQRENPQAFRALNRYSGIFVCINYIDEKNAVKLPEFINASFISGIFYPFHIRKYIATQGPLANTIQDFWKMVWVYNVRSIFMLCSIKDCQNGRCEFYWPNLGLCIESGQVIIRNIEENMQNGFICRKLSISCNGETRILMHNQYLNWPDCGLPKKRGAFIEFLNMMIQEESFDEPIVVHCSAGVGRTGTFIALSHIKQIVGIQKDMKIDIGISVFSIVRRLREQRMCMVETIEQFEFLYDFVCEIVDTHG